MVDHGVGAHRTKWYSVILAKSHQWFKLGGCGEVMARGRSIWGSKTPRGQGHTPQPLNGTLVNLPKWAMWAMFQQNNETWLAGYWAGAQQPSRGTDIADTNHAAKLHSPYQVEGSLSCSHTPSSQYAAVGQWQHFLAWPPALREWHLHSLPS